MDGTRSEHDASGRPARRAFLRGSALALGTALFAAAPSRLGAIATATERGCCPARNDGAAVYPRVTLQQVTAGNQQAIALAQKSSKVQQARQATLDLAATIADDQVRGAVQDVLQNPAPTYQLLYPTADDRQQLRQDLLNAGLIPAATTVDGIFPPVADANQAPQMFWSAPGSTYGGHHAFPGGLAIHEWVNCSIAIAWATTYETVFGLLDRGLDISIVTAPPLWHDIHKPTVMQWLDDYSELPEQTIADTGAHHPLSGAEAIVRGLPPAFVIAMLSAHDAPSTSITTANAAGLTGIQRLVNYLRAAAMIAQVDPVQYGLLTQNADGSYALAQTPPHIEGHINHLSDHDFIFSGDSSAIMVKTLQTIAASYGIDPGNAPRFNLFRNLVFSQIPDMRLYGALVAGGVDGVQAAIQAEADLSDLSQAG